MPERKTITLNKNKLYTLYQLNLLESTLVNGMLKHIGDLIDSADMDSNAFFLIETLEVGLESLCKQIALKNKQIESLDEFIETLY